MIFKRAHPGASAHFGDIQFLLGPLYCVNFLWTFWMMGARERHGTHKFAQLQPGRMFCSQPLTPDAEKIVILSQSKHFPIWETQQVTSSVWYRHHSPMSPPREPFVWRLWGEREEACLPRCHALTFSLPGNAILTGLGRSDYLALAKESCFWNQILPARALTCPY